MITAKMHTDAKDYYTGFTISGHADGYEGDGEYDLICAAVSAITLTIAQGLQDVLHRKGSFDSKSGYLHVDIAPSQDEKSQVLLETMVHGLQSIQAQYPDKLKLYK